jgi:hypothetical protein
VEYHFFFAVLLWNVMGEITGWSVGGLEQHNQNEDNCSSAE